MATWIATDTERNQCDGCRRGLPRRNGIHYDGRHGYMVCEASKYKAKPKPTHLQLLYFFYEYVGHCVKNTTDQNPIHPVSFDEWYNTIYKDKNHEPQVG